MSAEDHLSPQQFYHGTNADLKPGEDMVVPGRKHTYFTTDKDTAAHIGRYVLTVQPTGSYEPDDGGMRDSFKSTQPLNILNNEDTKAGT